MTRHIPALWGCVKAERTIKNKIRFRKMIDYETIIFRAGNANDRASFKERCMIIGLPLMLLLFVFLCDVFVK